MLKNKISLPETDNYYLVKDPLKGISVIANKEFKVGEFISKNYIAVIDWEMDENSLFQQTYPLYWSDEHSCIAFGIINIINHNYEPNCKIINDYDTRTIELVCIKEILSDEELTIDYGEDHYPFKYEKIKII
jgi:SET domain-containing protein